jgi:hypothetical protein
MKKINAVVLTIIIIMCSSLNVLADEPSTAKNSLQSALSSSSLVNSPWKPEMRKTVNGVLEDWVQMVICTPGKTMFSYNGVEGAQAYVQPFDGGVLLVANQWAQSTFSDEAAIAYKAPNTGKVKLSADTYQKISSFEQVNGSTHSLITGEGRVTIYKNNTKIWPTDANYVVIKDGSPVNFPTLEIDVTVGDIIRISGKGASYNGVETSNTNGWLNHIIMDPKIEYLSIDNTQSYSSLPEQSNSLTSQSGNSANQSSNLISTSNGNNPSTDDNTNIIVFTIFALMISLFSVSVILRRNSSNI